jgi:dienelactone hydrolase
MMSPIEEARMKRLGLVILMVVAGVVSAAVKTSEITYRDGKTVLLGYLAYDDSLTSVRPGVLVVHEWKGHGDYARRRARQLAEAGYVAFALDMYGKGVFAKNHEEAAELAGLYFKDRDLMRRRAKAGLDVLLKQKSVDPTRVAAIGYCFGGTTVLEMARAGMDLKGVASFHGNLSTPLPAQIAVVKAKVLVLQGSEDGGTIAGAPAFQEEMKNAGVEWEMDIYGGAVHSFTVKEAGDDPSTGKAYNANADRRSWQSLMDFLKGLGF